MRGGWIAAVVLFCVQSALAQEVEHLNGTPQLPVSENEIEQIAERRSMMNAEVLAYPNPSSGELTVTAPEGAVVTLYSEKGTYVGTWKVDESGKAELSDLSPGNFICTVISGTDRTVRKIVVL